MTKGAQLTNVETIRNFVYGGNATFTLVSRKTGNRYTYKCVKSDKTANLFFASVMFGPDNTSDFAYMGAFGQTPLHETKRTKIRATDIRFKAFAWFLNHLQQGDVSDIEFWHEGKCACCGRKLTVPESIEIGIGPECFRNLKRVK